MGLRAKFLEIAAAKDLTPFEKVKEWFDYVGEQEYEGHDFLLNKILTLESATYEPTPQHPHDARTVFTLTIPHELCNVSRNLHGGAVALIFDICTSTAIMACSKPGFWDTGHVSRTLNCTYLRPAPVGAKVYVESQVVHLGKRLAMTTGVIRNEEGKVLYTCEHGKAAVGDSNL